MTQFTLNFISIAYSLIPIVVIGCYGFRKLNLFYKLFLLQAIITMVLYAIIATDFSAPNQWAFNIYIVLEAMILMGAPLTILTESKERGWIIAGFIVFVMAYLGNLMMNGMEHLVIHAMAIEAVPVLIIYFILIYRSLQDSGNRPVVWLCLGLVLYCCGIVPAVGFITPNFSWLSKFFQSRIIEPLGHLRYFLTALSMVLYLRSVSRSLKQGRQWAKEI